MQGGGSRAHDVGGLVRPENFDSIVVGMEEVPGACFSPAVQRSEFGIPQAISYDAGIERIAPLAVVPEHPLAQSRDATGVRWLSVATPFTVSTEACARLERLGCAPVRRQSPMDTPQPFADRISCFDQATVEPSAIDGLPVTLAKVELHA